MSVRALLAAKRMNSEPARRRRNVCIRCGDALDKRSTYLCEWHRLYMKRVDWKRAQV